MSQNRQAKIVIDARILRTSTGRYVDGLLHYLQKNDGGHEYIVLLKPADIATWDPLNPHFSKLACPYKEFSVHEQTGLLKQIKQINPDLVFFPMVQQPILYRGKVVTAMLDLTTTRFNNPAKNPVVFRTKQQVYKAVNRIAAKKSKHIITISEFVKNDIVHYAHIPASKITVTYPAADPITQAPKPLPRLKDKQFIMYVGRPQLHKNLDRLTQAFAQVKKTHPDLHLVLAGRRDVLFNQLKARVQAAGIQDVVFTGFIDDAQLRWLYEHARAYVFPSLSEGFGLPGLEAMLYNLPVVSSNATCLPEIYNDAALYFDPLNVQDMAGKIAQVLDDKKLATSLTKKGAKQVKAYSWQRMADQTLAVFNAALKD